jgi:hypothetical protein
MNSKLKIISILLSIMLQSCNFCALMGTHKLGKNLYLFEGDRREDRVIIFNDQKSGCVRGGTYILPTFERHYDNKGTSYAEYVEEVQFDNKWIIVKTDNILEGKKYYWIIDKKYESYQNNCESNDCEGIIFKHIDGPMELEEFSKLLQKNDINLQFDN